MLRKNQTLYTDIAIDADSLDGPVDLAAYFRRPGPIEMEVGSGKGTFLVTQAKAFPLTNFLGIEWGNKYYTYAVDRLGRWQFENVRMLRTDAAEFIAEHVPDGCIQMFHLYFPDPWPKARHHKRRFFCDDNLAQLHRILAPEGIINVATDHDHYFEQMREVADRAITAGTFEEIAFARPVGAAEGEIVGTNYERKYIPEGRRTHTLALKKQ